MGRCEKRYPGSSNACPGMCSCVREWRLCLVNYFTPTSVMLGAPTMSTDILVCAEEGKVVRDSTGEHRVLRFKGAPVCTDERKNAQLRV